MITTSKKTIIKERLDYYTTLYEKYQSALVALIDGGVRSYMVEDRQLTKLDIANVQRYLEELEKKIDKLQSVLDGKGSRKAFAVLPRDW